MRVPESGKLTPTEVGHEGRETALRGRREELEILESTKRYYGTFFFAFHGEEGIGKTRFLHAGAIRIRTDSRRAKVVTVDLAGCDTPSKVGAAICAALAPHTSWARLPNYKKVEMQLESLLERIAMRERLTATIEGRSVEVGTEAETSDTLVSRMTQLAARNPKWAIVSGRSGWARGRIKATVGFKPGIPYERDHIDDLERLLRLALAEDLRPMAGRMKRYRRVYLLLDNHDAYDGTLAAGRSGDFVWELTRALYAHRVPVTVVVTRETPFTTPGDDGDSAPRIRNVELSGLSDEDAANMLREDLGAAEDQIQPLLDAGAGNPGKLISYTCHGLQAAVRYRLPDHAPEDIELLRLAAVPLTFDLELLSALAQRPVSAAWVEREVGQGTIESAPGATAHRPAWRVKAGLRDLLRTDLERQANP